MCPPSRRNVLQYGLGVAGIPLAGCGYLAESSDSEETPTATPTAREVLDPVATVSRQASASDPALVELGLTNSGDETATVWPGRRGGDPLVYVKPIEGTQGSVILFPQESHQVNLVGEFVRDDSGNCWRMRSDREDGPYRTVIDLKKSEVIAPGDTYTVEHEVYYLGPDSVCFPASEYEGTTAIQVGEKDGPRTNLDYTLHRDRHRYRPHPVASLEKP